MITAVLEILYYKSAGIAGGECRQSEFVALTLFGVGSATGASAYIIDALLIRKAPEAPTTFMVP